MSDQLTGSAPSSQSLDRQFRQRRLLPRPWRKAILMIHILVSVGWFGITAAILVLSIAALGLDDATLVREAYQFHELLISTIIRPAAIMTVVSGLSLALGTPWGLIKHYWPPAKLIVAIATIALTIPNSPRWIGYAIAHASTPGAALSTVQRDLVAMAVFHLIALGLATWLSIYKPGGLTPVGRAQTALRKRPAGPGREPAA
jgi:hypothetical protein